MNAMKDEAGGYDDDGGLGGELGVVLHAPSADRCRYRWKGPLSPNRLHRHPGRSWDPVWYPFVSPFYETRLPYSFPHSILAGLSCLDLAFRNLATLLGGTLLVVEVG